MRKHELVLAMAMAAAALVTATAAEANAQEGRAERATYVGPNRAMLSSGLITFGLSYAPAVVVAASSDQSVDHHLYVPVAGPWLDLANRPLCGPGAISCDAETTDKVLLVVDGVFQGIGTVDVLMSFLSPERVTYVTVANHAPARARIRLAPIALGRGAYGVATVGRF
jgi:hypothetical protein